MYLNLRWFNRLYHLKAVFLVFVMGLLAQKITAQTSSEHLVKGTVTDLAGEPIPGASVVVIGSGRGTLSGANGQFSLTISNATGQSVAIQASFVGYQNTTAQIKADAGGSSTVTLQLKQDYLALDEVVVTGTSVATSKRQLGNAISTVQVSNLPSTASTSIDQLLTGKVSGAQITQNSGNPAGGISIRLRGPSTIVGSSDPLYIVDGVIVNNSSPEIIDLGGYAQNRLVDINPSDIERIEVIKGAAAAAIYGSRANNGVVQIFTKRGKEGKPQVEFSTQLRMNEIRKTLPYNTVPFRFANTTASDLTTVPVERYDYQDKIFRKGIGTENYLSVSGGTGSTQYFFSASNLYNQGIIDKTDFSRNGARLRIQQRFGEKASLSIGSNYTYSTSHEVPNGGINEAYGALTGFIFANNFINPDPNPATGIYPSTAPSVVRRTNPLEAINRFKFSQRISRYIGDVQLVITPFAGLSLNYTLGIDTYSQVAQGYIPSNNTTPTYNQGYARRGDLNVFQINNDLNLSYQTHIADWLESTTGLGGTIQYDRSYLTGITAQQLGTFGETINNGSNIVASETRTERAIMGAFVQQTFGIAQKLFITGAARVDGSSVYGINNRWQFFPKVSGSYILSEEKFWKDNLADIVSSFKIRAAWGQSGNLTAIGAYDRFTNYASASVGSLVGYTAPLTLGNFDVKPERQTEFEFGVDLALVKDRIGIEFSHFKKDVKDLILNRTLAPSSGYNNRFINVGTMTNSGFEIQLKLVPLQTKAVKWNSTFSYTHNKNVVNGVEGNGVLPFAGGFGQVAAVNGYPLGAFYSTFFARKADGSLLLTAAGLPQRELGTQGANGTYTVGRNDNGQPTGTVLSKVIGNPNPKHIISWINEVEWKQFSFRMQWDGMLGYDIFNFTKRVGDRDLYGGLKGYEPELRGEVPKGTSAALFSIFENWIEDGSFVKLRELSVSYSLKPKVLGIQGMRIFVAGRNLLSIDNYSGYDPETNAAGQTNAVRGFDFVEVPIPRTYAIGVNVKF
ncbi:SusC/RagA family TonB-linked outer membrane protein [Cytophagaceae bacterium DM2B3-1]|uniref:SusC/RagA family TonB-linked outer membrane protein n=1 Tax=Xanthocytophaga flava TaxID=3048013 RepID=A0ABT7CQP7_9BACT|nr:SusC/RagA family TonB-linked outer membrane protein [Xanthocytophaga flavus]MDJ1496063.1 SusC/RagA family TonB-linked outer membrane protein [Xanthocytophaga flavus]